MYTPRRLIWREEMTTGVIELDAQHKYLIDIFNDLGYSIQKKYDPDDVGKVLRVMKYYAEWHFAREEECMARFHCPAAEKNTKAHAVFVGMLRQHQKDFEQSGGSTELATKLHEELSDWIVSHIMVVDTQLAPCVPV